MHLGVKERVEARLSTQLTHSTWKFESRVHCIKEQLALVYYDMKDAISRNLDQKEIKALSRIKSNPYF